MWCLGYRMWQVSRNFHCEKPVVLLDSAYIWPNKVVFDVRWFTEQAWRLGFCVTKRCYAHSLVQAEGEPWLPTFSGRAEVRQATTYQERRLCAKSLESRHCVTWTRHTRVALPPE